MDYSNSIIQFSSPYALIVGSYEHNRNNDELCKILAYELTKYEIGVISGGGRPGLQVASYMYGALTDHNKYDPTKIWVFYRERKEEEYLNVSRIGCKMFIGKSISEMRNAMLDKARVMISIGGDKKTKEEILLAEKLDISVIPVGMSGGISYTFWLKYQMSQKFNNEEAYLRLNNKNPFIAAESIVKILKSLIIMHD